MLGPLARSLAVSTHGAFLTLAPGCAAQKEDVNYDCQFRSFVFVHVFVTFKWLKTAATHTHTRTQNTIRTDNQNESQKRKNRPKYLNDLSTESFTLHP